MCHEHKTEDTIVSEGIKQLNDIEKQVEEHFSRQESAFYSAGRLLSHGVIDPRDTRRVLGFCLATCPTYLDQADEAGRDRNAAVTTLAAMIRNAAGVFSRSQPTAGGPLTMTESREQLLATDARNQPPGADRPV